MEPICHFDSRHLKPPWNFPEEIPERPRKRSHSVSWNSPREYDWDPPNPYNSRHLKPPEHFQNSLPLTMAGDPFFQKWFPRGPLRAGHGIASITEGYF